MKNISLIVLVFLIVFSSCKKEKDDTGSNCTPEEEAFYNNVIDLQTKAAENYTTWMETMDSLEVIDKLQQFFMSDPSVTSATIGKQGIAVQYSNGMRGGMFLNPLDHPEDTTWIQGSYPRGNSAPSNLKSLVNNKKMFYFDPHFWERQKLSNWLDEWYRILLPKIGFDVYNYSGVDNSNLDYLCQMEDYGIIQIYTHGLAWPTESTLTEVYIMTGQIASKESSEKYWNDILNGTLTIFTCNLATSSMNHGLDNVYHISKKFITNHNDFSKDTVLFLGAFCYSSLGTWPDITKSFAKGTYFGFDNAVFSIWCCSWTQDILNKMSDTSLTTPMTPEGWMNDPDLPKYYYDDEYDAIVEVNYFGDPDLTLWSAPAVGVSYRGGIVGYILQPGDPGYNPQKVHGLIIADPAPTGVASWGCTGTEIGGTSTDFGTGDFNTYLIAMDCEQNGMARICYDLNINGYKDWYLPSKDELNAIFQNHARLKCIKDGWYFSSSEFTGSYPAEGYVWGQNFPTCEQQHLYKDNLPYILAVRSF